MVQYEKYSLPLVAFTLIVGSSACGLIKNLDEMHDSTQKMGGKIEEMAGDVKEAKDIGGATYYDLRQGNPAAFRDNVLDYMRKANSIARKIEEAAKYFKGFEFQLINPFDNSLSFESIQGLYNEAVEEFFRDVQSFIDENQADKSLLNPLNYFDPTRTLDVTSNGNGMQNLVALATAMHKVNLKAEELGHKYRSTPPSMLSLMTSTLKKNFDGGGRRQNFLPYETEILRNEDTAVYLLQLRASFMGVLALTEISDLQDASEVKKAMLLFRSWEAERVASRNLSQLEFATLILSIANDTRDFLLQIGKDPKIHWKVVQLFRNLKTDNLTQLAVDQKEKAEDVDLLKKQIDRFRSGL